MSLIRMWSMDTNRWEYLEDPTPSPDGPHYILPVPPEELPAGEYHARCLQHGDPQFLPCPMPNKRPFRCFLLYDAINAWRFYAPDQNKAASWLRRRYPKMKIIWTFK